jgi:hypothetical protein
MKRHIIDYKRLFQNGFEGKSYPNLHLNILTVQHMNQLYEYSHIAIPIRHLAQWVGWDMLGKWPNPNPKQLHGSQPQLLIGKYYKVLL